MSRPVTLHVGLPKTGTTSLQMNLFLRHPQIAYVGKPLTRFSVAQAQVFEALMGWSPRRWREEQGALRTHVDELLASRPGERVVLSEEELSTALSAGRVGRAEVAHRLASLFPDATVLMVVRNQLAAVGSMYGQLVRVGRTDQPFAGWVSDLLERPEWLAAYDYGQAVQDYEACFSGDRVRVLAFEQLAVSPDGFVRSVCDVVGVDPDLGVSCFASEVRNASPTAAPALTDHLSAALSRSFAPGNRRLADRTGLDLAALGYPL